MYVLEQAIRREQLPDEDTEKRYLEFIKGELAPRYAEFIGNEIQKAYLESYARLRTKPVRPLCRLRGRLDRGSSISRTPTPGSLLNRELLNQELTKIEKPAGIANPKDFRNEIVKFSPAHARQQWRPQPVLDELRKDPGSDREAHVLARSTTCCR